MAGSPSSSPNKNSPGTLKMQCMVWEPSPIAQRQTQDYTVVYNATTIKTLPENIQKILHTHDTAPYGVFLKEKYVYRDTFLKIGDEFLQANRADMLAENGKELFTTNGTTVTPNYPYIAHQMFKLNGSLFSGTSATPSAIQQSTEVLDNSLSKWRYEERQVAFNHDGHKHGQNNDTTNDHDYVSEMNMQTSDEGFENQLRSTTVSVPNKDYILTRKVRRFMPMQIAATSEQKGRTGNENDTARPIHWLCEKETPLYAGEDFFVEFVRLATQSDIVPNSIPMRDEYVTIDAKYNNTSDPVIRNAGVVEIDAQGDVSKETVDTYNLSNQPYYLLELGRGDEKHNYFIILAYNGNPIFVHTGIFPVMKINSQDANKPPKIILPPTATSRRLSVYKEVSCKQLMDQETLRLTIREHLGKLIITFNGYEGKPWVISRSDYAGAVPDDENESEEEDNSDVCGVALTDVKEEVVPLEIAAQKIQIGGGNLKCGFMFAPLHYEPTVTFMNPNAITLKGPVEITDINLFLGDHSPLPKITGQPDNAKFFQDAELYFEAQDGVNAAWTKKNPGYCVWPMKADGKDCNPVNSTSYDVRNQGGLKISYIAADIATELGSSPITTTAPEESSEEDSENEDTSCEDTADGGGSEDDPADPPIPGAGTYVKWFNSRFTLASGDAEVGGPPPQSNSNPNNPSSPTPPPLWRITNCITPVATGWRLFVPQNNVGHEQPTVDVAGHVETFSHSWSYSDNAKVEHTGQIRFRINLGTPSSLATSTATPTSTDSNNPANQDHSAFLTSLADKTFFVRVYAWWEGGYMDCNNSSCPCRRPGGPGAGDTPQKRHCVFTGLAHGGEVTIEGNTRYMDCQLLDYMKIMQDQYFLNSPFFDGMSDYHAIKLISNMAGFAESQVGNDPFPPGELMKQMAANYNSAPNATQTPLPYANTGETIFMLSYTLPSSYDILQNPFMKFQDSSKYDEALSKIGTLAGKVTYFDRFGVLRYDVRPDARYLDATAFDARKPKCNFMASPHALGNCGNLDLLALNQYSYKRAAGDVVNDILLVTANPEGEVLVKSVISTDGRYDATKPGYVGYTKRLLQMDGIFGSQKALENIADYYSRMMFTPPVIVNWESMGVPHLQAMDIVTFTGLNDDIGFPDNIELGNNGDTPPPVPTVTLILTSVSGEIIAKDGSWRNKYEGEWLYGNVPNNGSN